MFGYSRTKTVLLALAQIWILVMGTLASGLHGRFTHNEFEVLPFPSALLRDAGFSLLWIPFVWVTVVISLQARDEVSEELKSTTFHLGWWIAAVTLVFVTYAVLRPWFDFHMVEPMQME